MLATWKAKTFKACEAVLPLLVFAYFLQTSKTISIAWTALFGLSYAWLLSTDVIPVLSDPLNSLPYPSNDSFIFGHVRVLFSQRDRYGTKFLQWMTTIPNDGLILFRGIFHTKANLLITTPEGLQDILTTHAYDYEKQSRARRFLSRVLGEGLIVVEGKEHKAQRKSVAPAFHGKHIRDLVPLFWRKSNDFTNVVANEMVGERDSQSGLKTGVIEISAVASRVTLDIIGVAGLGRDFKTIQSSDDELATQYESLLDPKRASIVLLFTLNMIFPPWLLRWLPWDAQRTVERGGVNLRRICRELVHTKKTELAEKPSEHVDILSVLVKSGNFDDDGLVNQLLTFLAAGHETTSSALTWALWLLSTHPAVQERTRREVLHFFPRSDENAAMDATILDEMQYLTAVCNEVLRLYPTVPNTGREAMRDTSIGNQRVPKGTLIVMSPWAINRSPNIWGPNAAEFDPDRWFGEEKPANQNPYNFLTFIHGPRSCIGQGFARSELRCLLAATLRRFHVEMAHPGAEVLPIGAISIKPKGGMELKLTELPVA